ncbi:MAG: BCD family MFS transporter [Ahrensia sp.]|nr:BCD family MFS transporter [Ahrensia sp.]
MIALKRQSRMVEFWKTVGTRYLPFADVATADLPLGRLLRLTMFQISIGMAAVLLTGTLNRVMIVELGIPTSIVALMVAIPVLAAPFRILIGHRSDNHKSLLGWRRVPYVWLGTLLQFGGLAIMPFGLLLMNSQTVGPEWAGAVGVAVAFLLTGIGMHMAQTAGLALATDLAAEENRPRVVALAYVMLLVGMMLSAGAFGLLLTDFSAIRLIQVIQGAAVVTLVVNVVALWKQEPRNREVTDPNRELMPFTQAFRRYTADKRTARLLIAVGLGSAAFAMQDVLLEPYGGEVLGLSVSQTTMLTALWSLGTLIGLGFAARMLSLGRDMHRTAAMGALIGVFAFSAVIFAEPLHMVHLFRAGTFLIGLGGGIFAVSTMLAAMEISESSDAGIAIGAWSAVQATSIGLALAAGGFIRDAVNYFLPTASDLSSALSSPAGGYSVVYHIEIGLLFASLIALGPLVGRKLDTKTQHPRKFGLVELPG